MKNFLNTLTFVIGTAVTALLIWAFLYLCIPGVKNDTDKLFKWGDYKQEQTVDDDSKKEDESKTEDEIQTTPTTEAQFIFSNDFINVIVG